MTTPVLKKDMDPTTLEDGSEDGVKASWIELNFRKRECARFIPTSLCHDGYQRCGCGRLLSGHNFNPDNDSHTKEQQPDANNVTTSFVNANTHGCPPSMSPGSESKIPNKHEKGSSNAASYSRMRKRAFRKQSDTKWQAMYHTTSLPTDAHGTLEFQGTGEGDKAQYIRLAQDSHPELIMRLLTDEWGLLLPKMLITVHGGVHNFQLQPKLSRVFTNGLVKAAKTTGAWIMLFGLNTGVGSVVGNALKEHKAHSRGKIHSIGVAPWGVVDNREDLIGSQSISSYQTMANPLSKGAVLHAAHTHFLLADNGTEGRYDSELKFRRRLERRISMQQITSRQGLTRKIPVVCLVLEGGKNTINVVLESVRQNPPIPVIVIDGSGRAADLLAFAHQYADDDGTMMEELRVQLLITIQNTFKCSRDESQFIYLTIMECVSKKSLITVFRLGQGQNKQDDLDNAILTASLKARRTSAPDMLSLALTWNRIDIAKSQIFVYGQHWPVLSLETAMMDALIQDRVDFVKLLMENGVSMHKFLTIPRLEELYNIKQIPVHLLYLLQDVRKNITFGCRFNLIEIGQLIESLMGGAYRSNYTRKRFRLYYATQAKCNVNIKKQTSFSVTILPGNLAKSEKSSSNRDFSMLNLKPDPSSLNNNSQQNPLPKDFQNPFHELMVWAVLMKRQKMALFMWQHGEEAIAKALVAAKLYRSMAKEAADDDLDLEEMEELKNYSIEFQDRATQLLEICYRADTDATQHLLTYELKQWCRHTCLSLAVAAQHRDFIAHPCVQLLLNDLWMGGLNVRKNSSLRVILGILVPPSLFTLRFKSQEELQLMPQTMDEHMDERSDSTSISSSSSSSVSSSTSSSSSSSSTSGSITSGLQPKPEVVGRGATGLDQSNQPPQDAYQVVMSEHRQLSISKKVYEFYNAPITKFWLYTMTYTAFLVMYTYVVLVSMNPMPSVIEWLVIAQTFTLGLEKMREVVVSEPSGAFRKIKIWMSHFWHRVDATLLLMFFAAFVLRMIQDPDLLMIGRAVYCVNIILWYIRLLNIFSVSKYLGPYVMMMGKMMVDLATFIILLAVVLMSFGVTRQALLHPKENASWAMLRDVFMEPYFMLYGEVYAGKIDPCTEENKHLCVIGSWIVPTAMTLYLLVANILLLNMLIAVFNNTFTKVKNISDKVWKFHRYGMIVEYESRPMLPPPTILLSYLVMLIRRCFKKRKNSIFNSDRGLKLFLDDEDVEKLHDFEEECLDEYFRQRDVKLRENSDLDVRKISPDRFERFLDYIDEAGDRDFAVTSQLRDMEERLAQLEDTNLRILDVLPRLIRHRIHEDTSDSDANMKFELPDVSTLRRKMRFHLRRMRQDSEMSTTSDWHPPTLLLKSSSHRALKDRKRIRSEQGKRHEQSFECRVRKTNSTGNIHRKNYPDQIMSTTTLATISSQNGISSNNLSKIYPDQEQKSVSCQDLMIMNNGRKNSGSTAEPLLVQEDNVISGSEFFASDYIDEPITPENFKKPTWENETRTDSQWKQKSKIRWTDRVESSNSKQQSFYAATDREESTSNLRQHNSSGNDSSCSSLSDCGMKASLLQRRKRSPLLKKQKFKGNKELKARGKQNSLPVFVINSPTASSEVGLTPVESIRLSENQHTDNVAVHGLKNSHTTPLLNSEQKRSMSMYPSSTDKIKSSIGRKAIRNFTPPKIQIRPSSNLTPSKYKSITDCIDTSRWHDANVPMQPMTPFESWASKAPDFTSAEYLRSPRLSASGMSQEEWEDEIFPNKKSEGRQRTALGEATTSTDAKITNGRYRRTRLYSNNSSSSIKSSSRRGRSRRHRHKRKKKSEKKMMQSDEKRDIIPTGTTSLTALQENSSSQVTGVVEETMGNSMQVPSTSKGYNQNNFNLDLKKDSTASLPLEKYRRDSFSERYAAVTIENCDVPGTQEVEKEQDVYVENEKMENENSPLLLC